MTLKIKTREKFNETKSWLFKMINNIKPVVNWPRKKENTNYKY